MELIFCVQTERFQYEDYRGRRYSDRGGVEDHRYLLVAESPR